MDNVTILHDGLRMNSRRGKPTPLGNLRRRPERVPRRVGCGRTYVSAYACRMLGHALDCGFTTISITRLRAIE